jgi:hypothetical protein
MRIELQATQAGISLRAAWSGTTAAMRLARFRVRAAGSRAPLQI